MVAVEGRRLTNGERCDGCRWIGAVMQKQLLQLKRRYIKLWPWPMFRSLKVEAGLKKRFVKS